MQELISKFGIDWKLIIVQVVNFGILFWLLKRFAYKPILGMLEERRKTIAEGLSDAKRTKMLREELEATREDFLARARKDSDDVLRVAREDATTLSEELMAKSREKILLLAQESKHSLEEEKRKALQEIRAEAAGLVARASAKLLAGVSDKKLDDNLVRESLK